MKWYRQLRWKLFISHLAIVIIANVVLIGTASFLASLGRADDVPITLSAVAAETGRFILGLSIDSPAFFHFQEIFRQAVLVSIVAALIATVAVSLFVSRHIVEPLHAISTVSQRLAQGFYRERAVVNSDDELADLSEHVNQLAEELEQTEQRRLALLSDVTHELRTPLATIEGYMEGMLDGIVRADRQTYMLILRETNRLQRLIEDLELLSRAEAGQIPIMVRPVRLRPLLEDLIVQFQPQCAADDINLELALPPILPLVLADADRIGQVLINLLANALRYTQGGGSVTVRIIVESANLRVSVEDTGIGITPDQLPNIFERFYRVDKSRSRTSGGSGIGLTIARHLIYAHGGTIWAESEGLGKGAAFHFTLPLAPSPSAALSRDQRTLRSGEATSP
ncbi:MAG: ATP-binding protein [Chloroflexales bacterium]|nr:ATP-binding protein [Chloroflexales bacterium]